jgi:organic hydroperoxide reductase OsmC/OhrA
MSEHKAILTSSRGIDEKFLDNAYSRGHEWRFDGGTVVPASSSPQVVPLPHSVEASVDPEEAFVASLSSCHMLFFLSIAAKRRFVVDEDVDDAVGVMGKDESGKIMMTNVTLRPKTKFWGEKQQTAEQLENMHHKSHEQCFIANSVKTEVVVVLATPGD